MAAHRTLKIFVHDAVEGVLGMRLKRRSGIHIFP